MARLKHPPEEERKIVLERFEQNLKGRHRDEKSPGTVMERLDKAGLPRPLVTEFLFAFTRTENRPRKWRRERERLHTLLLKRTIQDASLKVRFHRLRRQDPAAKHAKREKEEAERMLQGIKETGVYSLRRLGEKNWEYLVELQECATCVGSPLTDSELAALVWAAVSALDPNANSIETDSLARSIARFRNRNSDFVSLLREGRARSALARYRMEKAGQTGSTGSAHNKP
jgi:hypothetical protein